MKKSKLITGILLMVIGIAILAGPAIGRFDHDRNGIPNNIYQNEMRDNERFHQNRDGNQGSGMIPQDGQRQYSNNNPNNNQSPNTNQGANGGTSQ